MLNDDIQTEIKSVKLSSSQKNLGAINQDLKDIENNQMEMTSTPSQMSLNKVIKK